MASVANAVLVMSVIAWISDSFSLRIIIFVLLPTRILFSCANL
jgi:hypothetical protein